MSEQTNVQQPEQNAPSKEEVMAFLSEQIEVKKLQTELQELNTKLAKGRAEELQALQFIGNMTNPQVNQAPPANTVPHIITQEDLDANPELLEAGVKVGDEVLVAKDALEAKEAETKTKTRSLKK
jgi:hypothetical protein